MVRAYLLTLCLFAIGYHVKAQAELPPANVPLIFYCELDPQHSVSILADDQGPIYAYHRGNSTELAIHGTPTTVRYAYTAFAGGGGMYYRFIKGEYSYQIYSASFSDGTYREGVRVFKGTEQISDKKCQGDAVSNVPDYDPAAHLPEDSRNEQMTFGF